MKSLDNVIRDRKYKIELNNLKVLEYKTHDEIRCVCKKCNYEIIGNHRNLSNKKCRYCNLIENSKLVKDGVIEIIKIDEHGQGGLVYVKCNNGHMYRQDRRNLLANKGCKTCYTTNKSFKIKDVIVIFNRIHGDHYTYDLSNYRNLHTKIKISCKNGHTFHQKVSNHMQGKGCPICRESLGERTISKYLNDNKIRYERQKKFKECKYINHLPFDFYLLDHNICIEYDGIQHSIPVSVFGGQKEFEKTKIKDEIKDKYCLDNKIRLIRISYQDNILEILRDI